MNFFYVIILVTEATPVNDTVVMNTPVDEHLETREDVEDSKDTLNTMTGITLFYHIVSLLIVFFIGYVSY